MVIEPAVTHGGGVSIRKYFKVSCAADNCFLVLIRIVVVADLGLVAVLGEGEEEAHQDQSIKEDDRILIVALDHHHHHLVADEDARVLVRGLPAVGTIHVDLLPSVVV